MVIPNTDVPNTQQIAVFDKMYIWQLQKSAEAEANRRRWHWAM